MMMINFKHDRTRRQRILLVDDEKMITESIGKLLRKKGYDVTVAYDGAEAVELSQNNNFDLLITDIRMPHLDGISAIKIIRKLTDAEGRDRIPEIVMTGYAKEEYVNAAQRAGVSEFLYKPIDIWELLKSIKNIFGYCA